MSDPRAIGVFDSGIGGLTVLEALHRELPHESTVYLGDVARCPYGPRPQEEVRRFALEIAYFLTHRHALKMLVIACNTASAAALHDVRRAAGPALPVHSVIEPGARAAVVASGSGRIGVIATTGTVRSHAYRAAVLAVAPRAVVIEEACPQLVPLVEAGQTDSDEAAYWVSHYLEPLWQAEVDTVILGCTHYPLLRPMIDRVTAGRLAIVDSAHTTAVSVGQALRQGDLLAPPDQAPHHLLYTTGGEAEFRALAGRLFHLSIHDVHHVALTEQQVIATGHGEAAT